MGQPGLSYVDMHGSAAAPALAAVFAKNCTGTLAFFAQQGSPDLTILRLAGVACHLCNCVYGHVRRTELTSESCSVGVWAFLGV